jgi:hypothetical protein
MFTGLDAGKVSFRFPKKLNFELMSFYPETAQLINIKINTTK